MLHYHLRFNLFALSTGLFLEIKQEDTQANKTAAPGEKKF